MQIIKKVLACVLVMVMLLSGSVVWAEEQAGDYAVAYYTAVLEGLLQNYKFDADTMAITKALAETALKEHPDLLEDFINATADQFDAYTDYLTPEELSAFSQALNAEYVGIGVSIERVQGAVMVESVFAGGPAELAGIKAGDRFLRVDGVDVQDLSVTELQQLVRGQADSVVRLTMDRSGETVEFTVVRSAVSQTSVTYQKLEDGIGYLSIALFNSNTPYEVAQADAFFKERGIKKLIIDLRDNPGGDIVSVVNTLGFFVPKGKTVVQVEYNDKRRNYAMRSVGDVKGSSGYKLAVLINGGSASGAELFAGNVRDYKLGKLIGSRTYGKGTVQEFVGLLSTKEQPMGKIKLTVAEYALPLGEKINGVGIMPDIWQANRVVLLNTDDFAAMEFGPAFREGDSGTGVLALKQRFSALGYFVGEQNDRFDRELTLAVKQFQGQASLPVTGVMDMDTQTLFSNVVQSARVLVDEQFERAVQYLKTGK